MAFLYQFGTPRTKPLPFEALYHTSAASGLLNAAVSFFSSSKPAAASTAAGGGGPSAATAMADGSAGSSSDGAGAAALPDLQCQLQPDSPSANLALASQSRALLLTSLLTRHSIDKDIDLRRIACLRAYIPFIATITAQFNEVDAAEKTRIEKAGKLEWSSIIQAGARPNEKNVVPFFDYQKLDLPEELAHAYFVSCRLMHRTLGLSLYQRAGALSFHALQLANTIPPCSYLHLLPWYATECNEAHGVKSEASSKEPKRMFNPLSFLGPSTSSSSSSSPPKSSAEIAEIRGQIIAKRKEAVELLRQSAGLFDFLASDLLPSLPVPQVRMLDMMPAVSEGFKLLALVHCQQHTLLSALLQIGNKAGSGAAPPSPALLAKLLQGIVDKLSLVRSTLQAGTGSFYNAIESSMHHFLRVSIEFTRTMRLVVLGVAAEVEDEHGRAIGLLRPALASLTLLSSSDPSGGLALNSIRDCNPVLSELKAHIAGEALALTRVLGRLESDNDKIYFAKVPKLADALVAAGDPEEGSAESKESVFLPSPLAYTPPPLLQAVFLNTPLASSWASGNGGTSASAGAGGAGSRPGSGKRPSIVGADGVALQL